MLNVNYNINAKELETTTANFVAVWTKNNGNNYITAFGNDKAEVREEGYFHWAVMADYEGDFKVLPFNEINIVKN